MKQPEADPSGPQAVTGIVKWFDPVKGFGFVIADEGGADILLHMNVLRNFGQSSVAEGARIAVLVAQTERGAQASEIVWVQPQAGVQSSLPDIAELDREAIARSPLQAARIKWFDKGKGFGFANVFGSAEDVFVHMDVLRQSGLADLTPGEAIAMRVITGKRGLMAAEVRAWETVLIAQAEQTDPQTEQAGPSTDG